MIIPQRDGRAAVVLHLKVRSLVAKLEHLPSPSPAVNYNSDAARQNFAYDLLVGALADSASSRLPFGSSPRRAVSTSAACPRGTTPFQIFTILPSGPIQKVVRTIPINVLPRKLFMRRAP